MSETNFFDQFDEEETPQQPEGNFFDQFDEPGDEVTRLSNRGRPVSEGLSSANRFIAEAAGAPADIAAAGLDLATGNRFDFSERPFGGSEQIKDVFRAVGFTGREKSRDELTRAEQIASVGGETVGAAVSFLVPGTAALKGVNTAKNALTAGKTSRIESILQPAARKFKERPLQFTGTELSLTASAASGAATAEAIAPDNDIARFAGEVIGSITNPTVAVAQGVGRFSGATRRAVQTFTPGGREANAAKILQNLVEESGENSADIIRALNAPLPEGVTVTSGQRSGSSALLRLERAVAKSSVKFDNQTREQLEDAFKVTDAAIEKLTAIGSPDSLRQASALRKAKFDGLLERRIDTALRGAVEAAENIGTADARNASLSAENILRMANQEMRAVERELWGKLPKNIPVATVALRENRDLLAGELLEEQVLPFAQSIEKFITEGATSGEFLKLRSSLMQEGRIKRAAGEFNEARIADNLAEAVLDDLTRIEGTVPGLQEARDFSRSYNEVFQRGFTQRALGSARSGGERIPPEILLDQAFAGGRRRAAQRVGELQRAADAPGNPLLGAGMRNEQENFLNAAAERVLNDDGTVNPTKMRTFLAANAETLEQFPQLQNALTNADTAARELKKVRDTVRFANSRTVRNKLAFERLADSENITEDIGRILSSDSTEQQLGQLARLARVGGKEHTDGLSTAIFDAVIEPVKRDGRNIDYQALRQRLTQPSERGGKSLLDIMVEQRIIPREVSDRMSQIVNRMAQIDESAARRFAGTEDVEIDDITDLAVRFSGARIASAVNTASGGGSGGASLVVAGAGSRFLRKILEKVPASRTQDVLIKAANDPEFAAKLLKRVESPEQARELEKQINAALIQAGIIPKGEDDGE